MTLPLSILIFSSPLHCFLLYSLLLALSLLTTAVWSGDPLICCRVVVVFCAASNMSQMSGDIGWDAVCLWLRCCSSCMLDLQTCIQCSTPTASYGICSYDQVDEDGNQKTLHIMMCLSTCVCLSKAESALLYVERLTAALSFLLFSSPLCSLHLFSYQGARAPALHLSSPPCSCPSCCCLLASLLTLQHSFVSFVSSLCLTKRCCQVLLQ